MPTPVTYIIVRAQGNGPNKPMKGIHVKLGAEYRKEDIRTTNTNIDGTRINDFKKLPEENTDSLRVTLEGLVGKKENFENINAELRTGDLKAWIKSVHREESEIPVLLRGPREGVEFASQVAGRLNALKLLELQASRVEEDLGKRGINKLPSTSEPPTHSTQDHPTQITLGLECNLKETLQYIAGTEASIIGIFGACGIGKTTLLKEIERTVSNDKEKYPFTKVIFVDLKKEYTKEDIKIEIAKKLKLVREGKLDFYGLDSISRTNELKKALSAHTSLIMLDGLWAKVSFEDMGILPSLGNKIVYTTRLKHRCVDMVHVKTVGMKYLDKSDSSKLFKLATRLEEFDDTDRESAEKIVEKCGGLPLALRTLGLATIGHSIPHIYDLMRSFPENIPGMSNEVLLRFKASFDELEGKSKDCFLFCVLFQDSKNVDRDRLVEYWIGEGLVHYTDGLLGRLAEVRNTAKDIVEQLLLNCLLEPWQSLGPTHVWMHGIVHIMAAWLAKENFEFYAGREFDKDVVDKMKRVKRASLVDSDSKINEILNRLPDCKHMATLLVGLSDDRLRFHRTKREPIDGKSFRKMPAVKVLDMAYQPISQLPKTVRYLETLQYLNLSYTLIERLPAELGELTTLMQLDLTGTRELKIIPREAIFSLVNLRSLKLSHSAYVIKILEPKPTPTLKFPPLLREKKRELSWPDLDEMERLAELQLPPLRDWKTLITLSTCLNLLNVTTYLQLPIHFGYDDRMFTIIQKLENLEMMSLSSCNGSSQNIEEWMNELSVSSRHSPKLLRIPLEQIPKLKTLSISQDQYDLPTLFITSPPGKDVKLRKLHISSCNRLKSITCQCQHQYLQILHISSCRTLMVIQSLCLLQNLQVLEIEDCEKMDRLLSDPPVTSGNEDATSCKHQDHTQCLAKLRSLKLHGLPKLESISSCNLSFICLEVISVHQCEKLKELKINPTNEERKIKIECEDKWWKELKWGEEIINPSSFFRE